MKRKVKKLDHKIKRLEKKQNKQNKRLEKKQKKYNDRTNEKIGKLRIYKNKLQTIIDVMELSETNERNK